jgi:diguanylate cyclase (GGDEF)-like protein
MVNCFPAQPEAKLSTEKQNQIWEKVQKNNAPVREEMPAGESGKNIFCRYLCPLREPRRDFDFPDERLNEKEIEKLPGNVIGVLCLDLFYQKEKKWEDKLSLLKIFTDFCAIAWNLTKLLESFCVDSLTGFYNRVCFSRFLEEEISFVEQKNLSLILLDLDKLKNINDRFGYSAGNIALKKVAETLSKYLSSKDICVRYGEDEFAIILPQTGFQEAEKIAQKILFAIKRIPIFQDIFFQASLGITSF